MWITRLCFKWTHIYTQVPERDPSTGSVLHNNGQLFQELKAGRNNNTGFCVCADQTVTHSARYYTFPNLVSRDGLNEVRKQMVSPVVDKLCRQRRTYPVP